ncbi:UNVERIFIED_CONTAM: hypothetical protein K2H54_018664 [Gekko kuhli]
MWDGDRERGSSCQGERFSLCQSAANRLQGQFLEQVQLFARLGPQAKLLSTLPFSCTESMGGTSKKNRGRSVPADKITGHRSPEAVPLQPEGWAHLTTSTFQSSAYKDHNSP